MDTATTTAPGGMSVILIVVIIGVMINLPAYWAFRKAGWSGWWFLLLSVPLAGLILLYVFAFKKWPIEKTERGYGGPIAR